MIVDLAECIMIRNVNEYERRKSNPSFADVIVFCFVLSGGIAVQG